MLSSEAESPVRLAIHLGMIAHRDNKHWRQDRNTSTAPMRVQRQVHSPEQVVHSPDKADRTSDKVEYNTDTDKPGHKRKHRLSELDQSIHLPNPSHRLVPSHHHDHRHHGHHLHGHHLHGLHHHDHRHHDHLQRKPEWLIKSQEMQ